MIDENKTQKEKIDSLLKQSENLKQTQIDKPSTSNPNDTQYIINVERPRPNFNSLNEDKLLRFNTFDGTKNSTHFMKTKM